MRRPWICWEDVCQSCLQLHEEVIRGELQDPHPLHPSSDISQTPQGTAQRDVLKRQGELIEKLSSRAKEIRASKDARSKKIEKLRHYVADPKHGLSPLAAPLSLPLNARLTVTSLVAEKSSVFKSNLSPLLLYFETVDANQTEEDAVDSEGLTVVHPEYPIIFKNGDDLRQDQLVIQLFTLMDRLLRKENLDLRLSPYTVLATSITEGMIQFVPSKSLAAIMAEHGNLQTYLRLNHADDGALGSYGIEAGVMDTFVRSCGEYRLSDSRKSLTDDCSWLFGVDVCLGSGRSASRQSHAHPRR